MSERPKDVTQYLVEHASGNREYVDALMEIVYDQLKSLAAKYFQGERASHTLSPTAVVHEVYLRLIDQSRIDWKGEAHFRALAATTLRRVLIDYSRLNQASKRGGSAWNRVELQDTLQLTSGRPLDLLGLNEALEKLATVSARQAEVVELRFFGDLTVKETAQFLGLHQDTVKWAWRMARAWLLEELSDEDARGK